MASIPPWVISILPSLAGLQVVGETGVAVNVLSNSQGATVNLALSSSEQPLEGCFTTTLYMPSSFEGVALLIVKVLVVSPVNIV